MSNEPISEDVAAAAYKVLHDRANSKREKTAARLYASQHYTVLSSFSPAKKAAYQILRDPSRSKAAMVAAGLTLEQFTKR
ncbi:hypothetical protein [Stenotrophomonas sp. PD6]|uniref:hypothetical protein n=1 Tax=Stenotrophomonas sp. PD6 TaxID=3368612 RepID=UPI003B9FC17A